MSARGYIKLYRALFQHEFFRPSKFSEREAFTWMIAEAAWKPRSRRVGQFFVELDRGELVASLRHLGEIWQWEVGAVRGFLSRSERAGMLNTRSNKGITIVTVCNYDVYQGEDGAEDKGSDNVSAQSQQGLSTQSAHVQHKTEEIKQSRKEEGEEVIAAVRRPTPRRAGLVNGSGDVPALPKAKREPARTRVDLAWVLPSELREYARDRGWNEQRIDYQFEKFKNFHHGKGNLMASWPSAWRTWVGNDLDGKGGRNGGATKNRVDSAIEGMFSDLTPEDFYDRNH